MRSAVLKIGVLVGIVPVQLVSCAEPVDKIHISAKSDTESQASASNADATSSEETDNQNEVDIPQTKTIVAATTTPSLQDDEESTEKTSSVSTALTGKDCLNWEKLVKPEEVACFGSVDNVFASLPDWLKGNFSLMKASQSTQIASQEFPRVIVVSPSTNFIIAASSDPSAPKNVEVAVFDQVKEEWQFAAVDFTNPAAIKVEKQLCVQCHGSVLHPIWGTYPVWHGAVGVASPSQRGLSQADADFMNAAAAGNEKIPAIVRSLKFQNAGYYTEGGVAFTNTPFGSYENNQALNFVIDYKTARVIAGRVMADPKVTRAQKVQVFKTTLCGPAQGDEVSAFKAMGYDPAVFMYHGIVGKRMDGFPAANYWNGGEVEGLFVGAELFRRFYFADKDLQAKLPEGAALFQAKGYQFMMNTSTTEALSLLNENRFTLQQGSSTVGGSVRAFFSPTGKACQIIQTL